MAKSAAMLNLVTVKFKENKRIVQFVFTLVGLRIGDRCIVSTDKGLRLGIVVKRKVIEQTSFKDTNRDLYRYEEKIEKKNPTVFTERKSRFKNHL